MQQPKSQRHVHAANARWRNAEHEREDGIPDAPMPTDFREAFVLPLKSAGYRNLRIEPRLGYVAWRAVDEDSGELVHCAAIKELLRWIAGEVPRMLAARNFC